jgi:hypothetical protein
MRAIILALAVPVMIAAPSYAQAPAPAAQAAPQQRNFNGDGGLVLIYVKPDQTAAFETAMGRVKEALIKSEKPERKQQAAGWKLFKAGSGPAGQVYVFVIDPSVKGADYSIGALLGEAMPQEAKAIYDAYFNSLASQPQVVIPLDLVSHFGK